MKDSRKGGVIFFSCCCFTLSHKQVHQHHAMLLHIYSHILVFPAVFFLFLLLQFVPYLAKLVLGILLLGSHGFKCFFSHNFVTAAKLENLATAFLIETKSIECFINDGCIRQQILARRTIWSHLHTFLNPFLAAKLFASSSKMLSANLIQSFFDCFHFGFFLTSDLWRLRSWLVVLHWKDARFDTQAFKLIIFMGVKLILFIQNFGTARFIKIQM